MEAGANNERMAHIVVEGDMRSPNYLSKSTMMSRGFDTIPADFSKEETDQIYVNMVRILVRHEGAYYQEGVLEELEAGFGKSGLTLAQVMGEQGALDFLEGAGQISERSDFQESFEHHV